MARRIPITGRQGVRAYALVDGSDYDALAGYRWCLNTGGYAMRVVLDGHGNRYTVLMHREVLLLKPHDGFIVDHVNRNRLDNRRENLRVGPRGMNAQNHSPCRGSTSRFRGVSRHRDGGWQAQAQVDGQKHYLGYFQDELEAARVAADFRRQHMPFATD